MKTLNLNDYKVYPMDERESKTIDGGVLPLVVGLIFFALMAGYTDGRRDKND